MTLVGRKGVKMHQDMFPLCVHSLFTIHIVDNNFEIYNIMHFNYFYRKCHYTRHANILFGGHIMCQLVGIIRLQTFHMILCDFERTHDKYSELQKHCNVWQFWIACNVALYSIEITLSIVEMK